MGSETDTRVVHSYDLYAVVREARGWAAESGKDVNLIVRDLLWLRRENTPTQTYKQSDDHLVGLYVSAMDQVCFYVERVEIQSSNVFLTARTNHHAEAAQRLTLIYEATTLESPLHIRDGILSGWASEHSNLAAWKCLLIRPNWDFFHQLRTIMAQANLKNLEKIYNVCADVSAIGVCFSDEMREIHPDWSAQARREAFRRLVATDVEYSRHHQEYLGKYMTQKIHDELQTVIADQVALLATQNILSKSIIDIATSKITDTINRIAFENWHLIEPAQLITFRRRSRPRDTLHDVECLIDLQKVKPFSLTSS